ncbi:MAG: alpha/beta fold hydrolase [Solirubrobacterales bacterium]|nr:alpha/beta fold hydrolase [Solirubrobacterales bacterium]
MRTTPLRLAGLTLILLLLAALAPGAASAQSSLGGLPSPGISPPGANDPNCKPTQGHTRPIVLVHGTGGDMTVSWNLISPALAAKGYCVFALDYGERGIGPIEASAAQLSSFVDGVLTMTGAKKVTIIGHSQGGMMPRWYMKFLGGKKKVAELVGLVPSNHGTNTPLAPLVPLVPLCPACTEQATGSDFLTKLNAGDETPGAKVSFTQITTRYDEVVNPFSSAFLEGPKTTNVLLQDKCPNDNTEHNNIIYDKVALQWVMNALHRKGLPADPAFTPTC